MVIAIGILIIVRSKNIVMVSLSFMLATCIIVCYLAFFVCRNFYFLTLWKGIW